MRNIAFAFLLTLGVVFMTGCRVRKPAPPAINGQAYKAPVNGFRVVGYLLSSEIADGRSAGFDVARVNYLNVFFNAVTAQHKFRHLPHLDSTITAAHKNHVIVLGAIGNAVNVKLLDNTSRAMFVDSLLASVTALHLDGIDVDLEDKSIDKNYEAFTRDLSAALHKNGKLMTAAVATWESRQLSDKALSCFDYLNIMSYDAVGPWDTGNPGPHSPYSMAVNDLDFWTNTRHISKSKLNLGLPFYGYGFGPAIKQEFHYWEIVKAYPGAETADQFTASPGNTLYYNGIPTVKQKTAYAMKNAGGVMLWELLEDATGPKSLLNAVDQTVNPKNK